MTVGQWKFAGTATFVVLFFLLAIGYVNQWTKNKNLQEIMDVRLEMTKDKEAIRELEKRVSDRDRMISDLNGKVKEMEREKNDLLAQVEEGRERIAKLESDFQDARMDVIKLVRTGDDLAEKFKEVFPQYSHASNWGLTEIYDSSTELTLQYAVVPVWALQGFIEDHLELDKARSQVAEYLELEKKYGSILELDEQKNKLRAQVSRLEYENRKEYERGLKDCQESKDKLAERYIDYLEKPRFETPTLWKVLTCAAAGAGGAILINKAW